MNELDNDMVYYSWREFKDKYLTANDDNAMEYEVNYDKDKVKAILYFQPYSMCGFCSHSCGKQHNDIKAYSINDCTGIKESPNKLDLYYDGETIEIILDMVQLLVGLHMVSGEEIS